MEGQILVQEYFKILKYVLHSRSTLEVSESLSL